MASMRASSGFCSRSARFPTQVAINMKSGRRPRILKVLGFEGFRALGFGFPYLYGLGPGLLGVRSFRV